MEIFTFTFEDLFEPTLKALHVLGGSASVQEIEETVADLLNLSEAKISDIHSGNITKFSFRLAQARNYLRRAGFIDSSTRDIWSLTKAGTNLTRIDIGVIKALAEEMEQKESPLGPDEFHTFEQFREHSWQEQVLHVLKSLPPEKFERLCQRLLREMGFVNVVVTGKIADGGIDGKGVYRLGGMLSFHVIFQCKRYTGSVSSSTIRDFRGALIGRGDKGLIITTGSFTREAKKEAQRDGAPAIDLVDGGDLAEKLRKLQLGIEVEVIEKVKVNKEWFNNF